MTAIEQQLERFRTLYDISADAKLRFDQQLARTLEVGTEALDLDLGIISRIEGDQYTVVYTYNQSNMVKRGQTFELGKTFCCITVKANDVVTIDHHS